MFCPGDLAVCLSGADLVHLAAENTVKDEGCRTIKTLNMSML